MRAIQYEINGEKYELVKVTKDDEPGEIGYDIYKGEPHPDNDPINLGEIAHFDVEPTRQDLINYLGL